MKFDYGKNGLEINMDPAWNATILYPDMIPMIKYPIQALKKSIRKPIGTLSLKKIIQRKETINQVCIVVNDATRPVPSHIILQAIVEELNSYGINDDQILILIATGLHRPSRDNEIERILSSDLKNRLKVLDHSATDKNALKYIGITSDNVPIYINRHYFESDLKILIDYVEPHFFFGFSGGRKSIVPGIMGEETIKANHSAENIDSAYARFGIFKENPMHKNAIEICQLVGADFIVNVCINEEHKIVKVASGDLEKAHEYLVNYQLKKIFKEINEQYDIVVCGNGGYPLDLDLYQAVKSMAIGEMAVKNNGIIISANELSDGIGHEQFKNLISCGKPPNQIYDEILNKQINVPDQWEIQILTRILMKAEIYVVSKLNENELGNIGLKYAKSVEKAIKFGLNKFGPHTKILIIPNGSQILPLFKKNCLNLS